MYCTGSLSAMEDGSIVLTDADDITIVEPITTRKQTAGGYYIDEADLETAALMAAAPDLFFALQNLLAFAQNHTNCGRTEFDAARAALAKAQTKEF